MKKRMALLLAWVLIWSMAFGMRGSAAAEEETIVPNRVTAALAEAETAAGPFRAALERFLDGDEEAWSQAAERGKRWKRR